MTIDLNAGLNEWIDRSDYTDNDQKTSLFDRPVTGVMGGSVGGSIDVGALSASALILHATSTPNSAPAPDVTFQTIVTTAPAAPAALGVPNDPGLNTGSGMYQWHLTGTHGVRANTIWPNFTGGGIKVAVFDDGFDYSHADLSANYRQDLDLDTLGNDNDARSVNGENHGTAVAGMIAADDNGSGVVGVAFDSQIIGIKRGFGAQTSHQDTYDGFVHALNSDADVMNNSWGSTAAFGDNLNRNYTGVDFFETRGAIEDLVELGRSGLGTSVVFAAGNSRAQDDNTNYHNFQNNPYVITVAATDASGNVTNFSTPGASILVGGPGEAVWTTDQVGGSGYVSGDFVGINGTSFSAPLVSGIIALMLDANENLGYRDVQDILALTARQSGNNTTYQWNDATNWNGGGMHFSHDLGFGLVDAAAAVRLAETWTGQQTFANLARATASNTTATTLQDGGTINSTINVAQNIEIERVVVDIVIPHARAGDLVVTLIGPGGTQATLIHTPNNGAFTVDPHGYMGINFELTSTAFMGELSAGNWTLQVQDLVSGATGTLQSWSIEFLGSAVSTNDVFVYTDEILTLAAARRTLSDTDGGTDTINLSALSQGVQQDMTAGGAYIGQTSLVRIANGVVIENLITTDFADTVYDNGAGNTINLRRGNDTFFARLGGSDVIDGGEGTDLVNYQDILTRFTFSFSGTSVTVVDTQGTLGQKTFHNFEQFSFAGTQYNSIADLQSAVAASQTGPVNRVNVQFVHSTGSVTYRSQTGESQTLDSTELGINTNGTSWTSISRTATYLALDATTGFTSGQNLTTQLIIRTTEAIDMNITDFRNVDIQVGGTSTRDLNLDFNNIMRGRITSGAGDDTITVTLQQTQATPTTEILNINSGAGNDVVTIDGAHPRIQLRFYGEDGDDTVSITVTGNHIFYGGQGNDTMTGWNGIDYIYGESGNDIIRGGGHDDFLSGGTGDDIIYGDLDSDRLFGNEGSDTLYGGVGVDRIFGGDDNDTLFGDAGNDFIYGDAGVDRLVGGGGQDMVYGGTGGDTFVITHTDGIDRFEDFNHITGDRLEIQNLLTGFVEGSSDIDNFVRLRVVSGTSYLDVNIDGAGNDWQATVVFSGGQTFAQTIQQLYDTDILNVT